MQFERFVTEMTDFQRKKTHGLDIALVWASNEFERLSRAFKYADPKDLDDIVEQAYKVWKEVRGDIDKSFHNMGKSV